MKAVRIRLKELLKSLSGVVEKYLFQLSVGLILLVPHAGLQQPQFIQRQHTAVGLAVFFVQFTKLFRPALFVGDWAVSQLWLFWLAPLMGAAFAGFVYRWLADED